MAASTGTITIPYGDNKLVLRCTMAAAKEIDAYLGSITAALARVAEYKLSAFVTIVAAGSGKDAKDVEEGVFATGMKDLAEPLSEYLVMLANGGRKPVKAKVEGADAGEA